MPKSIPSLETFQTACAKVGGEGWWHLMPRLQGLAESRPKGFFDAGERGKWLGLLEPLREAERASAITAPPAQVHG